LHQQRTFSDAIGEICIVSATVPIGALSDAQIPMPRAAIVLISSVHTDSQLVAVGSGIVVAVQDINMFANGRHLVAPNALFAVSNIAVKKTCFI